jgi:hypothetical protein
MYYFCVNETHTNAPNQRLPYTVDNCRVNCRHGAGILRGNKTSVWMKKDQNGFWRQQRAFVAINRRGIPLVYSISTSADNCRKNVEDAVGSDWKTCVKLHGLKVKKCSLQIDVWE